MFLLSESQLAAIVTAAGNSPREKRSTFLGEFDFEDALKRALVGLIHPSPA